MFIINFIKQLINLIIDVFFEDEEQNIEKQHKERITPYTGYAYFVDQQFTSLKQQCKEVNDILELNTQRVSWSEFKEYNQLVNSYYASSTRR